MKKSILEEPRQFVVLKDNEQYFTIGAPIFNRKIDNFEGVVTMPNIIALYLSISDKAFKKAEELAVLLHTESNIIKENKIIELLETETYDLIENLILTTTFSYFAVEASVNASIPARFEINVNGELKNKEWIERNKNTTDKIKNILPKAYNKVFEARKITSWSNFKKLEILRNEIVHKKGEIMSEEIASKSIQLLKKIFYQILVKKIHLSARDVIKYIGKLGKFLELPYEFSGGPVEKNDYFRHVTIKNIFLEGFDKDNEE